MIIRYLGHARKVMATIHSAKLLIRWRGGQLEDAWEGAWEGVWDHVALSPFSHPQTFLNKGSWENKCWINRRNSNDIRED